MTSGDQFEVYLRLLLAIGLGGLIGLEREIRGHEAGMRTSALVALGAAVFGSLSVHLGDTRVAAGVVQGVGFLAAGLIIQQGGGVRGVTTATMLWVLTGVGLMVGNDLQLLAILTSVTIVAILELAPLSSRISRLGKQLGAWDAAKPPAENE